MKGTRLCYVKYESYDLTLFSVIFQFINANTVSGPEEIVLPRVNLQLPECN